MRAERRSRRGRGGDRFAHLVCLACAAVSILVTMGIIGVLAREAFAFFRQVPAREFFFGTKWTPLLVPQHFGVLPLVVGTAHIAIGSALISLPLGLLSAIYLAEYAKPRTRAILKPILELLAGVPTVVYGYFALMTITPFLKRFLAVDQFNALSGAIVVGVMTLPLVSSLCEDALRAVPKAMREGAYGLGATRAEVTLRVAVPAALSGIMASFILAISRAIGETMAVSIAAGNQANLTFDPRVSIQTMTAFIVQATQGEAAANSIEYRTLYAVGATLFVTTFLMNILAQRLVKRFRLAYE